MTTMVKWLITIIGVLSLISGIFLAYTGSDFSKYISGILVGAVLIGSVFFYKQELDLKKEE